MSSQSSSDSEGSDGECARLKEAVEGVTLQVQLSAAENSKHGRCKPKRSGHCPALVSVRDEQENRVVSRDMQTFLARKLAEFLDSQYEVTDMTPCTTLAEERPTVLELAATSVKSGIRLLQSSEQPISLESPPLMVARRKRNKRPVENSSSESDSSEEKSRLMEAVVEPEILLKRHKNK